jgi:hypothetical protein
MNNGPHISRTLSTVLLENNTCNSFSSEEKTIEASLWNIVDESNVRCWSPQKKRRLINVRHMNAFLIVPRIVYNLSTKLQKGVLHDHLGQNQETHLKGVRTMSTESFLLRYS